MDDNKLFEICRRLIFLIETGEESAARDGAIQALAELQADGIAPTELLNHVLRRLGLFPYMEQSTSAWKDALAAEVFRAPTGGRDAPILHREQSLLLKRLLDGDDLAVSAPTSFGKSFVIDFFIEIRKPDRVMIVVPTIALVDETRRRLNRRFGRRYRIVTGADEEVAPKTIFILTQERAYSYIGIEPPLDMFIIDEFYKASSEHDRDRSISLVNLMIKMKGRTRQRYYLGPNIDMLNMTTLTEGMEFLKLDCNTVYLTVTDHTDTIRKDQAVKESVLLDVLSQKDKSLIYAGSYPQVKSVSRLLVSSFEKVTGRPLLAAYHDWLAEHYGIFWELPKLVERGVGVHTGRLHRSLAQIHVRLFDDNEGLDTMIATSSIIEGVNTAAEQVILWNRKIGSYNLRDFTYKNIIGRSGRMFRYFVGFVHLLERAPDTADTTLTLDVPENLWGSLEDEERIEHLSASQKKFAAAHGRFLERRLGPNARRKIAEAGGFSTPDTSYIEKLIDAVIDHADEMRCLKMLHSDDPNEWRNAINLVLTFRCVSSPKRHGQLIDFVVALSTNWSTHFIDLQTALDSSDLGIDEFFELERWVTFQLASLFNDISTIIDALNMDRSLDCRHFAAQCSTAFLPSNVHRLEEYGLPRMLAREIHLSGTVDLVADRPIEDLLDEMRQLPQGALLGSLKNPDLFDRYFLDHFLEGIEFDLP